MTPAPQPRMHGLTHVPGGSDPIPRSGCCPPDSGCIDLPAAIADLAATRSLEGYWRVGEPSGSFADSSGLSPPSPGVLTGTGTAPTRHVTGALDPSQDDGAAQFTVAGSGVSDPVIVCTPGTAGRFENAGNDFTIAAFVKPAANAGTWDGGVAGNVASSGASGSGYCLIVEWPSRTAIFIVLQAGGGGGITLAGPTLTADTWYLMVGTYSTTGGAKLYLNGALVASSPTLVGAIDSTAPIYIGRDGPHDVGAAGHFLGVIDEVSVWGDDLTVDEITDLYTARLCTGLPAAGKVITADGTGSTTWSYPTIAATSPAGRYDTITLGTNLAGTDLGSGQLQIDGSVGVYLNGA